nr:hypothetical protein [bacterium]
NNYLITKGYDKTDNYYYNDDNELIKKDIDKLLIKNKMLDKNKLRMKLYSSLITKGYDSSLINEYLNGIL